VSLAGGGVAYSFTLAAALLAIPALVCAQAPAAPGSAARALVEAGQPLFLQNCGFCHGRDAGGGESGPDLTASKLVLGDRAGENIAPVIRAGRPDKGMPKFNLPEADIAALVAFIHHQRNQAAANPGGRRSVAVADLQTGNVEAGKQYFNGAGTCSKCHSPSGDLAGVAKRFQGLKLEQRFLYPHGAAATVRVTVGSGESVSGTLIYRDEFTIGLRDADGWYHSWPANRVKYSIDDRAEAHAELLSKYTDADIHNLMAYLQTLR
jgi:cytochrome c oxidase cbb3-type subunit 3